MGHRKNYVRCGFFYIGRKKNYIRQFFLCLHFFEKQNVVDFRKEGDRSRSVGVS